MAIELEDNYVDGMTDFLPGAQILLVTENAPSESSSTPLDRNINPSDVLAWGESNDYPQRIISQANLSPELLSLIDFVVSMLYGGGLYYEVSAGFDDKGKPLWKEGFDPEVEAWISANEINSYFLESVTDYVWFNNCFPELIKNKKGDRIVQITHQESAFCRYNRQNKSGYHDTVGINANWPNINWDDELTLKVLAIDPYDLNKVETVRSADYYKFIFPFSYPAPGKLAYQMAIWHALFKSQWFDLSVLIPVMKKALMQYQMTIKYVIKVPQSFWDTKAKEEGKVWNDLNSGQKKTFMKSVKKDMNDFLTGAKNAGKSFMTTFGWDNITKTEIPGITIEALDDKLKDGKYIEDSKEASSQFIRGLGIPAPLIGPISSGDMGGGSGSDARIHFNILNNRLQPKKDKLLSPLNFIAQYNGWVKRMPGFRWKIREFVMDTLDVNHSTSNPSPKNDGQSN